MLDHLKPGDVLEGGAVVREIRDEGSDTTWTVFTDRGVRYVHMYATLIRTPHCVYVEPPRWAGWASD